MYRFVAPFSLDEKPCATACRGFLHLHLKPDDNTAIFLTEIRDF